MTRPSPRRAATALAALAALAVGGVVSLPDPGAAAAGPVAPPVASPTSSPSGDPGGSSESVTPTPTSTPAVPGGEGDEATPGPEPSATAEEGGGTGTDGTEPPVAVPEDPLQVVIQSVTPGEVPSRGPVRVTGTVRNRSDTDWTELSVYLATSDAPFTTEQELAEALVSDPRSQWGTRIVEPGLYVDVPDLAPGKSAPFRLSVPRDQLGVPAEPGVYWLGVHVLGTSDEGRIEGADGRARTFLPLVPARNPGTTMTLGLQLRNHTVRAADGRLEFLAGWQDSIASDGRLGRLLGLGRTAGGFPLTWFVDAAVVEAVGSVGAGNPPVTLSPRAGSGSADDEQGRPPEAADGEDEADESLTEDQRRARSWVEGFVRATAGRPVLALPYGDLDVAAAYRHGYSRLVGTALEAGVGVLDRLGVAAGAVVAPADGFLSPEAAGSLEADVPLVLRPEAVRTRTGAGPLLARGGGGRLLLGRSGSAVLGAQPAPRQSALMVRQRLLADAALHALSPDREEPLVRLLPPRWDPGPGWRRADFFGGLDVPWLTGSSATDVLGGLATSGAVTPEDDLRYPTEELEAELGARVVATTEALSEDGRVIDSVLTGNDVIGDELTRQALLTSAVWSRIRPRLAAARATGARAMVSGWLDRITVRGPSFVTMSSETGTFQVTVVNGLDQPVAVGLRATVPGGRLRLTTPEPVELAARGRSPMQIEATSTDIGIHLVTLQPVSVDGAAIGQPATTSIRSSRVGFILWLIMAVGGAALAIAIVFRIRRRILARRRTHGPLLAREGR